MLKKLSALMFLFAAAGFAVWFVQSLSMTPFKYVLGGLLIGVVAMIFLPSLLMALLYAKDARQKGFRSDDHLGDTMAANGESPGALPPVDDRSEEVAMLPNRA